jgi:hypothetical protein
VLLLLLLLPASLDADADGMDDIICHSGLGMVGLNGNETAMPILSSPSSCMLCGESRIRADSSGPKIHCACCCSCCSRICCSRSFSI